MFCGNCGQKAIEGWKFCKACGRPLQPPSTAPAVALSTPAPSAVGAAPTVAESFAYAGFWRRLCAAIADGILLYLVYVLIASLLTMIERASMARMVFDPSGSGVQTVTGVWSTAATLLPWLLAWVYSAGLEASPMEATPGKRLLGLRVTDLSGNRASLIRTTFRNALKPLSGALLLVGFLMAGFTARKQALHDMLAGCLVMRR